MPSQEHRRPRVLILNATYLVGGVERVLQQLALNLQSRLDIVVCALYQPGTIGEQMSQQGLPVYALHGSSRADIRVLPRFVRLLRQVRPDTLFTIDAPYAMIHAVIAKRLRLTRRLVIAVHSFGKIRRTREMALARRLCANVTDTLIALSETHRRFLLEQEGWRAREVLVIPNGVDLERFSPEGPDLREKWGLTQGSRSFGIVAGLRVEKNLYRFLRVADRVLAQCPQAHAFIVGEGDLRDDLERYRQRMEHGSRITFTGMLHDIPAVWRTLDVAVLTSDREVLPMTLMEASACGVPAVSTDVGVVRDIVLDGKTGFVVSADDEASLAGRIAYLLEHPEERKRMGEQARQHAEMHFDLSRVVEQYAQVLAL